jgi:hypothetical protein
LNTLSEIITDNILAHILSIFFTCTIINVWTPLLLDLYYDFSLRNTLLLSAAMFSHMIWMGWMCSWVSQAQYHRPLGRGSSLECVHRCGGSVTLCTMGWLSHIPCLCPLDTSSLPLQNDNRKCLQTMPNVPWVENHWSRHRLRRTEVT